MRMVADGFLRFPKHTDEGAVDVAFGRFVKWKRERFDPALIDPDDDGTRAIRAMWSEFFDLLDEAGKSPFRSSAMENAAQKAITMAPSDLYDPKALTLEERKLHGFAALLQQWEDSNNQRPPLRIGKDGGIYISWADIKDGIKRGHSSQLLAGLDKMKYLRHARREERTPLEELNWREKLEAVREVQKYAATLGPVGELALLHLQEKSENGCPHQFGLNSLSKASGYPAEKILWAEKRILKKRRAIGRRYGLSG